MTTKTKTVKAVRWAIGYERAGDRVISTKLYTYNKARKLVSRLRRRGNDAWLAGALRLNLTASEAK